MEETKELQTTYKIFRYLIYMSLIVEFFEYAINPELLDYWGGILCDIHDRIKRWYIYQDGNLIWSKMATFVLICVTCIGTRNKKQLEFDARHQVFYPLFGGLVIIIAHRDVDTVLVFLQLLALFKRLILEIKTVFKKPFL